METSAVEGAERANRFGLIAMAIAALALCLTVTHWVAGPFNPSPPLGDQIIETVGKLKDAAQRAVTGSPAPEPDEPDFDIDRALQIIALSLAGLAMGVAIAALARREQQRPALIGFSLGGAVIVMLWLQWLALALIGLIIIAAIANSVGDIFSF